SVPRRRVVGAERSTFEPRLLPGSRSLLELCNKLVSEALCKIACIHVSPFLLPELNILYTFASIFVRERVLMKRDLFRFIRIKRYLVPWRFCVPQLLINYLILA